MFSLKQFARSAHQQFQSLRVIVIRELHTARRMQLTVVIAIALTIGLFCTHFIMSAHDNKKKWSAYQSVLVTKRTVRAGELLTVNNTTLVRVPTVFVPITSLTALSPSTTARIALSANTIVSISLTVSDNNTVDIPEGWRGVAMPRDLPAPPLSAGDVVDVVSIAATIAPGAVVVAVSLTDGVTLAVPADLAPVVATAFRLGEASLVLTK
jgi:hypothetical protein